MTFSYNSYEEFSVAYQAFLAARTKHETWNEVDVSIYDSWASRPTKKTGETSYIILGINYEEETS
jgi:hypothetical protein